MTVVQQAPIWVDVWGWDVHGLTCCMNLSSLLLCRQILLLCPFQLLSTTVTNQPGVITLDFTTPVTDRGVTAIVMCLTLAPGRIGLERKGKGTWKDFLLLLLGVT